MTAGTARAVLAAFVWTGLLQLVGYLFIRRASRQKLILAWAAGAAIRLVGLVVFALLVVPAFGLPLTPALLWLAVFLFVSTMIESYLLNRLVS